MRQIKTVSSVANCNNSAVMHFTIYLFITIREIRTRYASEFSGGLTWMEE
ncbi:hypothetical protein [Methanolapillus ohkumae]